MSFKICTIGCGWIATATHGPSYKKYASINPGVALAACCDIDRQKAEAFRNTFGFKNYYTDVDEMLSIERPDAVCLNVPPHLTASLAVKVMEKGFPLITEKPPGRDREEIVRLITAAEKYNIPHQVAFNRRFMPLVRKLKGALAEHLNPSDLHHISCDFFRVGRTDADFSLTAIHGIDTVRCIADSDYRHIRFYYQELPRIGPTVANIYMDCTFKSGAAAHLRFCPVTGVQAERITISSHNHTFLLNIPVGAPDDALGRLMHFTNNKLITDVTGRDISVENVMFEECGFYQENESFFNDVQNGRMPVNDFRSALQSVVISECIRNRQPEYYSD